VNARGIVLGVAVFAALVALFAPGTTVRAEDDPDASLLEDPEKAPDAERLRRVAEAALEKSPKDERAMLALLVAVTWLRDKTLLDDAIERAKPIAGAAGQRPVRFHYGRALLRRARMDDPPSKATLEAASAALGPAYEGGAPAHVLDLAHARHLLNDTAGAQRAYARVVAKAGASPPEEELAERAIEGLRNVLSPEGGAFERVVATLASTPAGGRAQAGVLEAKGDLAGALAALDAPPLASRAASMTPRTSVARARLRRRLGRHDEALAEERRVVAEAGTAAANGSILEAVERIWRELRPLGSFADCAALDADYDDLVRRAAGLPHVQIAWLNNLAFRLREVVSTYTWRGEGRSQGIADGSPREVHRLLARCVELYEAAVALVPKDAADAPFAARWVYAGILNDAGLMRHYFVDVRDLAKAEALYLRAFELTDGAYMDTYFYNLQYLYGFELPGREETWLRLAQRARTKILAESKDGGFVPDERKREAAARDAEALRQKLEERKGK
jgi:hypothetical protein